VESNWRKDGGEVIGVIKFCSFNQALLGKWLLLFGEEGHHL
jgi:hypothetical protein